VIILDTNVLSELMKAEPAPRVVAWFASRHPHQLYTTSITEAEIFYGIDLLPRSKRRTALLAAAAGMFAEDFVGRILSFDSEAARVFALLAAGRRAIGKPIGHLDAQIAAIARVQKATLATRNVDDFDGCGLDVLDPWS
jgi:hypothetical protein